MTCRDFQRQWDELLDADARSSATASGEPGEEALLDHTAGCADCRRLAARYHVLRQATRVWKRPPVPPADLVDRILAAAEVSTTSAWPVYADVERARPWKLLVALGSSVAAAVLAAILLPRISMMIGRAHDVRPANPPAIAALQTEPDLHAVSRSNRAPGERSALNRALAEASSATWDLALSASEPAARISREVLDATTQPDEVLTDSRREGPRTIADRSGMAAVRLTVPVPSLALLAPDPSAASAAFQQVGDHVAAGVRPLSDTARHAFGFLIGPAPDQAAPRNRPPSAKGA
jgi:nitroreductase